MNLFFFYNYPRVGEDMKKRFSNKGFTLIELLAVIAILAVIMLIGGQSVFGALQTARKGAFKTEVGYAIQSAQAAYQVDVLNQKVKSESVCYPISWLKEHEFYEKKGNDASTYQGSVLVSTTDGVTSYKIWMTGGEYLVKNGTLDNLTTDGTGDGAVVSKNEEQATVDCNKTGTLRE